MKKISFLLILMLSAVAAQAGRPLLVGHRGSAWGLENSVESFTNGAKMGYEYLETDFKVTKDKQYVCTHDDDTKRLGGTKTIASSTLEEIQSETLSQTRNGVKYTGRLCSAQEYLDVCKEYNVKPLIELKWATGINSNDCSGIPALIKFIEDNGFRNKCIILTSMKPCLEYIRKNYPDIELQFLTGQYWESHFDWCVELGIDVDIQSGYFDKNTVTRYHDEGLKVNMWTANTDANYRTYGNMGCDFITTDNLDPKTLPELDASVMFPPNTIDYPNVLTSIKGNYSYEKIHEGALPSQLGGVVKAIARDGQWIALTENGIMRFSALNGEYVGQYSSSSLSAKPIDIATTAEGYVVALCDNNKAYYWTSLTAAPAELFSVPFDASKITVSGKMRDLKVYLLTAEGKLAGVKISNGVVAEPLVGDFKYPIHLDILISPYSRDNIIIAGMEVKFNWEDGSSADTHTGNNSINPGALSFHRRGVKVYAMIPSAVSVGADGFSAKFSDATSGIGAAIPVASTLPAIKCDASAYHTTGITRVDDKVYLHLLSQTGGLATYLLDTEEEQIVVEDINLELETIWVQSNTTGNHPGNIDGTNAQQGTGIGGKIYVNDCNDQKIYIFDGNGLIGSIPGGKGWGCARDDAGNIIVRDDKLTGTEHSFIIYPAGTTPENPGTPVKFTAPVKLDGQTNFINAGGDLLGGTGHIYLYPNGQNAINIITVEKGVPAFCSTVTGLSLTGSTAGYVIPQNDDPEKFLYNVRASGIYLYNGGVNEAIMTTRSGTTAPARNTTGGGAMFMLGGNQILLYNSGAHYKGGFTIKNLTTNAVFKNINPIGELGYVTGGNSSTFNWLIAEKISNYEYLIHQYCPANGIALYRLYDKNNAGVDDILSDKVSTPEISINGNEIEVKGSSPLEIYNISGMKVLSTTASHTDISALLPGLYIARSGASALKFAK